MSYFIIAYMFTMIVSLFFPRPFTNIETGKIKTWFRIIVMVSSIVVLAYTLSELIN